MIEKYQKEIAELKELLEMEKQVKKSEVVLNAELKQDSATKETHRKTYFIGCEHS